MKTKNGKVIKCNSFENGKVKNKIVNQNIYSNVNSLMDIIFSSSNNDIEFENKSYYNYETNYFNVNGSHDDLHETIENAKTELIDIRNNLDQIKENTLITNISNKISDSLYDIECELDSIENEIIEMEDLDPTYQQIHEYYICSPYFIKFLKENNEPVWEDECIWGRTTTGQAILLDSIIDKFCYERELFVEQIEENNI